ncbi:MAG TPA: NAD-dependent epimerase/dehydratase family protein [Kofleriaceae bacterium]|nr:NAD-dependent epimerase/dehydratase family protein [Kofleriaceae bacterium]
MKILVVGGRGFIGSALTARLRELGHDAVATGRADTSTVVAEAAPAGGFDALVWAAGGRPVSAEQCVADHAHAAVRTARSLPGLKRVVYLSSAEVYGLQDVPFKEDMALLGASPLGQAKIAGEHGIVGAAPQAKVTILRPCWVYGPGLAPSTFLPTLIHSLAARRRYPMTPGMQTRDMIYVDDMVRAIVRSLDDDAPAGTFNIGAGRETSILDMALLIAERVRDTASLLIDVGARPYREGEAFRVAIDVSRARDVLGFTASIPLEDGLTMMVDALVPDRA